MRYQNNPFATGRKAVTVIFISLLSFVASAQAQKPLLSFSGNELQADFSAQGISRLSSAKDPFKANVVGRGGAWGRVKVLYRMRPDGDWINHYDWDNNPTVVAPDKMLYTDYKEGMPVKVERIFEKKNNAIDFTVRIQSSMHFPVSIGDIAVPLPWSRPSGEDPTFIFEQGFTKHQYIGGGGSYMYFTRASGQPPFMLVTALPGTRLEYFEAPAQNQFSVFIHSKVTEGRETRGTWRLKSTSTELTAMGQPGSSKEFKLRMQWVNSYDEMRQALYENGLFDIRVIPGMTVPLGLKARFSLHTKNKIDAIVAEHPQQTTIKLLETKPGGYYIYEAEFKKLGENMLTIQYNGNENSALEFFTTEPIETVISKRSAFITKSQQHRDASKWYNGLYSVWDMKNKVLRGPDNTDGFDYWWGYVLAADDPGLCKAPFVASKNVYMPVDDEISSLEYYIKNFVWGGLQRTDKESSPYGVHGVPNWHEARDSLLRLRSRDYNLHVPKIWRAYDYPHIFMLYYHMFQIAEFYPDKVKYLDAKGYLQRAVQTARAYFTYPYAINSWYDVYKWGCYNELVLVPMLADMERYGMKEDVAWLKKEWEKKVKYFVYDDKYPFRSEYSVDRTAFESSYAFAKYGATEQMQPDDSLWYDINVKTWRSHPSVKQSDSRAFMERQLMAGLAFRGWITPSFYALGSDDSETGGLSYMARMGGWGVLDYGIEFAEKPWDWLQLGYASYLSSYALINTGTAATNYGYWFPGKENDGATGWAYSTRKYGRTWLQDRTIPRGPWNYDGEADLGNGAITRTASTLIANDPLFGWIAYGSELNKDNQKLSVIPQDGVRIRFGWITEKARLFAELSRDKFSNTTPIITDSLGTSFSFSIINEIKTAHPLQLKLSGTAGNTYAIKVNGKNQGTIVVTGAKPVVVNLQNAVAGSAVILTKK